MFKGVLLQDRSLIAIPASITVRPPNVNLKQIPPRPVASGINGPGITDPDLTDRRSGF